MISAYGPRAEAIRDLLPAGIASVVIFDESGLPAATAELARRRAQGEAYLTMPLIDDVRVRTNMTYAVQINRTAGDADSRYYTGSAFGQGAARIGGKAVAEIWAHEAAAVWAPLRDALALTDGLLLRSYAEYATFCAESAQCRTRAPRRILLPGTVPAFERRLPNRPGVVVWPGRRDVADATLALIGMEEFRGDVVYTGGAPLPNIGARFVARDDPALPGLLGVAGCIVCIDPSDPADAVAFARRGIPVVAPATCGAYEFTDGIVSWDAGDSAQLSIAVNIALGRVSSRTSPDDVALQPAAPRVPACVETLPLVSILTATYNRREELRRMLTCLAEQSYPNIESIVVNDAGESVADIVAAFPFARLIDLTENRGSFFRAAQAGLAEARGAYIGMLPDDDRYYPDHIERLMSAILRSGAPMAHGFGLMRFLRRDPDGVEHTYGINTIAYANSVTPTMSLVGTQVPMHQTLQRRDIFDESDMGWPLLDAVGADQEYHMRLLERYQFAAVDVVTTEFRDHPGNSGKVFNWADAMRHIYALRPATGRPYTEQFRRQAIEKLEAAPPGESANRPHIFFPSAGG